MRRLLVPVLLVAPSLLSAQGFEGTITTQMYSNGAPKGELVTSYKGGKTRLELPARGTSGYMLINAEAGIWQTVMVEQKMYMTMNMKETAEELKKRNLTKDKGDAPRKITRTGKTETIAGRSCEHVVVEQDEDGVTVDICAAKGLGFYGIMGAGPGAKSGMPGGSSVPLEYRELAAQFKDGFQPLKMERVKGANRELVMQVKSIEPKSLPAAMFEIPAGFREFNAGAMLKGGIPKIPPRKPR